MAESQSILVVAEQLAGRLTHLSLEALTEGRRMADRMGASLGTVVIGGRDAAVTEQLALRGADVVYELGHHVESAYTAATAELHASLISTFARCEQFPIIVCSSGATGYDLAPRLAAKLSTTLVLDCLDWAIQGQKLLLTKPLWGGKVYATLTSNGSSPQICTIMPGVSDMTTPYASKQSQAVSKLTESSVIGNKCDIKVTRSFKLDSEMLSLDEADIIVAGGRGVGSHENWSLIERLAKVLGGVSAGSQGAVDAGLTQRQKQVGLSGKIVSPQLYIACGISGATHHVMGMRTSRAVVAINKDRGAPIFKVADVSIVGDVKDVLPALIRKLLTVPRSNLLTSLQSFDQRLQN